MKVVYSIIGIILGIPALYFIVMYGASELGGEVVTLDRTQQNGEVSQVRIWIVDQADMSLIEHGDPEDFWLSQLKESPHLVLHRAGRTNTYLSRPDPDSHALYHELRREKYGWADNLIAALSGSTADCRGLPVRLQLPD